MKIPIISNYSEYKQKVDADIMSLEYSSTLKKNSKRELIFRMKDEFKQFKKDTVRIHLISYAILGLFFIKELITNEGCMYMIGGMTFLIIELFFRIKLYFRVKKILIQNITQAERMAKVWKKMVS